MADHGSLFAYLADDHRRLEGLFERAMAEGGLADSPSYAEFRRGLLRHIGIEEKLLLPAAQARRGGEPLEIAARVRRDHSAIAALLVPIPSASVIAALSGILAAHNAVEEGPGGLYELCEALIGDDAPSLLAAMQARPEPPVVPLSNNPLVIPATRRVLALAGYEQYVLEEP